MKIIKIPLIDKSLWIWVGPEEWERFKAHANKAGYEDEGETVPGKGSGKTWGSNIWIYDKTNIDTVYHELQHFLDNVFSYIECGEESEFKAYIAGCVHEKLFKWLNEI